MTSPNRGSLSPIDGDLHEDENELKDVPNPSKGAPFGESGAWRTNATGDPLKLGEWWVHGFCLRNLPAFKGNKVSKMSHMSTHQNCLLCDQIRNLL